MSGHTLQGRTAQELLWVQRRSILSSAAAWVAMGGWQGAHAQSRSNIVTLQGDASVNGQRLLAGQSIAPGDHIATGPEALLIFVIGSDAFHVRQNSRLTVAPASSPRQWVGGLRLLTGAVISVWGKGDQRQIETPTITAGIRGTGAYIEVWPKQAYRSYFCNCYGTIDLSAGADTTVSQSSYHQSFWGEPSPKNGRSLTPAGAINHTDEELEFLAALAHQQTAWQIAGRKGMKDGKGYMDDKPGQMHPAEMLDK